ncbi:MAG: amidase [Clostridia bacterium]|nr:amidase [Clostridia bacterium]
MSAVGESFPGPLEEATLADLQAAMERGELGALALVRLYLERIALLDRDRPGLPGLRAVVEVNPEAEAEAARLDAERRQGRVRGPLHGIPVLLKENIDTGDRMRTSAGSLALAGAPAPRDATVVARLRAAGAVLLGKANLSEWANFRSLHSVSGWSARGGQTRNPYALDRSPSGSSSGSAAAVAANLCAAALGTETDGSIVSPSAACGVVGVKPTVGLTSRAGVVPIAHSQDTVGPIARTVRDAALLLSVIAGPDERDPATRAASLRAATPYEGALGEPDLRGLRLGVAREGFWGFSEKADAVCEEALRVLRDLGAELVDPADLPSASRFREDEDEMTVLLYEFKADLEAYLAGRPGIPVRTLADLIAWNEEHAAEEMPFFGQELFEMAVRKGSLEEAAYREALARSRRLGGEEGIDAVLRRHRLDALVAPSGGPAWLIDPVNGDRGVWGSSGPAARAGYPLVTVPAGFVRGLPVGLTFMGTAWSEPVLLRIAHAFEQATRARKPPRLLPHAS